MIISAFMVTIVSLAASVTDTDVDKSDAAMTIEVGAFLDRLVEVKDAPITVKRPYFILIPDKYGEKRAWAELHRQIKLRDSDYLFGYFFSINRVDDENRDLALRGLKSKDTLFHDRGLSWCVTHIDKLDDEQKKSVREILVAAVKATNGKNQEDLRRFVKFGTKQDIPWMRRIYQEHHFQPEPNYTVAGAFSHFRTVTPSHFRFFLAQLGDPELKKDVAESIGQDKNVQQRVWGIVMAANLGDKSLVPLISKSLDDKRKAPEPIEEWRDPDAKGPHLLRVAYHRVCDVALRAIWTIDGPKENWPFEMDSMAYLRDGSWTFLHGMSNELFPYVEPLEKKPNQERGIFLNHTILGYTDEQLEQVREYVKKRPAMLEKSK